MSITDAVVAILILLVVWSFYLAQRDPSVAFNLFDLIMENGRVSKLASAFMLGVAVLSWIMVKLTLTGKMSEGYMGLYGGIVIAPVIAKLFSPPPPPSTSRVETTSTETHTTGQP